MKKVLLVTQGNGLYYKHDKEGVLSPSSESKGGRRLYTHKDVNQLSKGMRQRLVLARAVLHKPKILFLDEPTSALDPVTARGIHKLIRELRASGSTIFLTTHNMEEAATLCDRVVLLHKGTIIEQGTPKDICERYSAVKTVMDLEAVFVELTGEGLA